MKAIALKNELIRGLTPIVGAGEATAMVRDIFSDVLDISPVDLAVNPDRELLDETVERLRAIAARVVVGEPLQYVLGTAHFMGMRLKVTPATLIPRPETAQLVDIITDNKGGERDLRVLDIGTGSGCIAIALARALPFARVTAFDISDEALAVARENAANMRVDIDFKHVDILKAVPTHDSFDVIVSNPPYIAEYERKGMDARVFDHEPSTALFVPDNDPLLFYRKISKYALTALSSAGSLFFEINPLFVSDLTAMLKQQGWRDVDILRDFDNKKRFAVCHR